MPMSSAACCWLNQTDAPSLNASRPLVSHTDTVLVVVTVILSANISFSWLLNSLLLLIIQYSPSLRTPPNSHLLNLCLNNLLLCVDMLLCVVCINYHTVSLDQDKTHVLSGLQLFLTYTSLLQYWTTFASIGYYRHRTIKKPGLSLRNRRQLVSRSVLCNWLISTLLGLAVSLSYVQSTPYASATLDPFMRNYIVSADRLSQPSQDEHIAVTLVILLAFSIGLAVILTAYYSICRTLNVVSSAGRNRVSPHQQSLNLYSHSSDLTWSLGRSYRPQFTISNPAYVGGALSRKHKGNFLVTYNKKDNSITVQNSATNTPSQTFNAATRSEVQVHSISGQRKQLSSALSNASTCSVKSKAPEFTDISIGAELLRFQRHQSLTLQHRQSFKRESISLSSAIRNSLAMLIAYCTCSLPLIIVTVPEPAWVLSPGQRLQVLLICRLLFYLNAPVYPLWYLTFSVTVKKCFIRLWEGVLNKYRSRF